MPLTITNYPHGGVLLSEPAPFALDDKTRADILEKWDAANYDGEVDDLLDEAEKIASPRAFLRRAYVTDADETGVTLTTEDNGEEKTYRIDSPLVAEKLRRDTTVVGTVATCGRALYDLSVSYADDPLLREVAEDICLAYMRHISIALHVVTVACLAWFVALLPQSWWIWVGAAIFTAIIIAEHIIVTPTRQRNIPIAFGTLNGLASLSLAVFVIIGLLTA